MKITLRKANALQTSIQEHLKSVDIELNVALNEFQNPETEIDLARAKLVGADQRRANLTTAMYAIRAQVGQANAASGVSDQLARAAYIDKRIGQLKGLSEATVTEDLTVIKGKLDRLRNTEARSRLYGNENVTVGVLTQAQVDQFKTDLNLLKKEKQAINDKVLELNIRTEIELTDDVVKILQSEQIV